MLPQSSYAKYWTICKNSVTYVEMISFGSISIHRIITQAYHVIQMVRHHQHCTAAVCCGGVSTIFYPIQIIATVLTADRRATHRCGRCRIVAADHEAGAPSRTRGSLRSDESSMSSLSVRVVRTVIGTLTAGFQPFNVTRIDHILHSRHRVYVWCFGALSALARAGTR